MKRSDLDALMRGAAPVIRDYVSSIVTPIASELTAVKRELAELKARPLPVNGRDGTSLVSGIINDGGCLILTLSDGTTKDVGRVRGAAGKDGEPGPRGEKGDPGADGKAGAPGPAGPAGKDGERGADGINGKDGAPGRDGQDGKPGENGRDGKNGVDGKNGIDGAPGKDGRDGINGTDGAPGEPGPAGKNGLDGTPGPAGPPGPAGRDGKDGVDGAPGEPGAAGKDGADGRDGVDGTDGKDGAPGAAGERGVDGRDGRDGKDADMQIAVSLVSAEIARQLAAIPTVKGEPGKSIIYKGVYAAGGEYQEGNAVTYGGSLWIALEDTKEKPGDGKGWQLAVKRGRDGKDAAGAQ